MIIADQLVLPGIQHAFFTREGGVSEGIYASLNGGVGSNDSADAVRENRAIMASHFGIVPDRLVTVWRWIGRGRANGRRLMAWQPQRPVSRSALRRLIAARFCLPMQSAA